MGSPVELRSVAVDSTGHLIVQSEAGVERPAAAWIETSYARPKGEKILHRLPVPRLSLTRDPNLALTKYTWLLVADTNQPTSGSRSLAWAGMLWTRVLADGRGKYRIRFFRESVLELHNLREDPERVGWALISKSLVNLPADARVGLIVDSHLGRHRAIANREEPLLGDMYLPQQFEILYASADAARGYFANDLLRRCDSIARAAATYVAAQRSEDLPPLITQPESEPFEHMRIWDLGAPSPANSPLQPTSTAAPLR